VRHARERECPEEITSFDLDGKFIRQNHEAARTSLDCSSPSSSADESGGVKKECILID
jgi:hypothetical protein